MSIFVEFNNTNCNWDVLLKNKTFITVVNEAPKFSCATFEGLQILEWDSLNIEDVANKARAGGVDTNNINGIISELHRGYRATELPPIVMILPDGEMQLWDGYNRYAATYSLGIHSFPFVVYKLNEDWADRIEDAYDIVSLGANNHTVSKRHTIKDFVVRGIAYCKRQGKNLSKEDIQEWIDNIEHSFIPKQVETIINQIYLQTTIAVNIVSFPHPKSAQSKFSEIVDTSVPGRMLVCTKEESYMNRAFIQIMKNYVENDIDITDITFYTKGCETAEEVIKQREDAVNILKKWDDLALRYATKRLSTKKDSYRANKALPQLNGIESPVKLVDLDY